MISRSLGGDRTFVLLDGDSIFGPAHLAAGFMNAGRSIREGRCRAKQPSMEVLRFLGGSRQVSGGAKRVSPGKRAGRVLLAVAPSGWPAQEGPTPLPEIDVRDWDGPEVPGLEGRVVDEPSEIWGGAKAARVFGLKAGISIEEMEAAIIEMVATADLI